MYLLFSLSLLISATLVFWVQPLFGKMVLPLLGGSPAVWNTCLVFFQTALLMGYLYAHAQSRFLGIRKQFVTHLILLAVVFFFLPVALPAGWSPPVESSPIWWLLLLLTVAVGLPFVTLSATAPLLQNWFAHSRDPHAADPYFLYAASNVGSIAGLVGYPVVFERKLTLAQQAWAWTAGYALLFVTIFVGAAVLWRRGRSEIATVDSGPLDGDGTRLRFRWVLLAAVPSSLLQSVTYYLTTDLAAMPLLWVIPLALYLLTFVLVFSRRKLISHDFMVSIQPAILIIAAVLIFWWAQRALGLLFVVSLIVLFTTAMTCHGEMVRLRPRAEHLTEFYLWMAFGGVLGGTFNAIVAPLVFDQLLEFPIGLVFAALLVPAAVSTEERASAFKLDVVLPVAIGVALCLAVWALRSSVGLDEKPVYLTFIAGLGGIWVYLFRSRPLRFGLGLAAILAAGHMMGVMAPDPQAETILTDRSFFGIHRVELYRNGNRHVLRHGGTVHGMQWMSPQRRLEPTMYYHHQGPVSDVFKMIRLSPGPKKVAIAGLGAGSMAAYALPGDHWVFYEIDPVVERLARDPEYFTFLKDCRGRLDVVMGDARLSLAKAPDGYYDLIVVDVFSSDSIPVHMITKEATQVYFDKLNPHGLLLFHISNRYLRLNRVLYKLMKELELSGVRQRPFAADGKPLWPTQAISDWVVLARDPRDLKTLAKSPRWKPLVSAQPVSRAWTDDYSNLLEFFRIPEWNSE